MRLSEVRTSIHKVKWGTDVEGTYGTIVLLFFGVRTIGTDPKARPYVSILFQVKGPPSSPFFAIVMVR